MNDKYAKEIAKELRLIRIELQKLTTSKTEVDKVEYIDKPDKHNAGERVTIK